jgi:hypothetical protein
MPATIAKRTDLFRSTGLPATVTAVLDITSSKGSWDTTAEEKQGSKVSIYLMTLS